jgi:hypothetical protein
VVTEKGNKLTRTFPFANVPAMVVTMAESPRKETPKESRSQGRPRFQRKTESRQNRREATAIVAWQQRCWHKTGNRVTAISATECRIPDRSSPCDTEVHGGPVRLAHAAQQRARDRRKSKGNRNGCKAKCSGQFLVSGGRDENGSSHNTAGWALFIARRRFPG